ncbi:DUF6297 domain-containing protein [Prescottella defluvii]
MALTDSTAPAPSARTVRAMQRRFARAHAPGGNRAGTIVTAALGVYVVAGLVWWLTTRPATALADSALLSGAGEWNQTWAWVAGAAVVASGAAVARAVGPLTASREYGFWLLTTPTDRAAMLRPRALVTFAVAAIVGAAGGRLAAYAGTVTPWAPLAAGGAAFGVSVAAIAVLTQARVFPARTISTVRILFTVAAAGAVAAATAGLEVRAAVAWTPVGVVVVVSVALASAALHACGRITAAELDEGADIAVAAQVSVIGMDLGVLTGVVDERAWRRIAHRPTRMLPPGRARALIRIDALRHLRRRSSFVVTAVTVAGAWAISGAVSPIAAGWVQAMAVFAAAVVFSSGLRELSCNPELAGMLGADDRSLRRPLVVVPACAAVAVAVATAPLVGWSVPALVIGVVGACGAAYRLRTRMPTAYDGLVLEIGIGHLPIDVIRQKLRGPDWLILTAVLLAAVA